MKRSDKSKAIQAAGQRRRRATFPKFSEEEQKLVDHLLALHEESCFQQTGSFPVARRLKSSAI